MLLPQTAELLLRHLAPIRPKLAVAPAGIEVWQLDLRQDEALLLGVRELLTGEELAAADRFVRAESRRCHLLSKAIVRAVLGRRLGLPPREVQLELGPWGKPALRCSSLHYNVSHSGDHLLLALAADRQVGVDLERIRPRPACAALAERSFSPVEFALFQQVPEAERLAWFYRQWASKEALLKAWGLGLTAGLQAFDVADLRLLEVRNPLIPPGPWPLLELAGPEGHAAVLAWQGE